MKQPGFIFGGNTGMSYDQVQKQRDIANELLRANMSTPQNVGEGLSAIGRALAAKAIDKRTSRADEANRKAYEAERDRAFQALGGFGGTGGGSAGYSPSGTWTPAPPPPKPTDSFMGNPDTVFSGGNSFGMPAPADATQPAAPLSFGSAVMTPQEMLIAGAEARGLDPIDVATAISYETGGKFDPLISGPTTQWGTHKGLIQFGEPQAQQHGAKFDDADTAWRSQLNPNTGAVWNYLDSTGVKPGMGLDQIYSAINAGGVNRFGASDANNGGAPGTVADKVAGMAPHRENAARFLGGTWTPTEGQPGAAPQPAVGAPTGGMANPAIIMALAGIQGNPYASDSDKAIANVLIQQTIQAMDPMRQMEIERAQLEIEQMRNPQVDPLEAVKLEQAQLDLEQDRNPPVDPFANTMIVGGSLVAPDGQGGFAPVYTPPADPKAPETKNVKLSDGSDALVQWNPETQVWDAAPIPQGGTSATGQSTKLTESQSKLTLFQTLQQETAPVLLDLEKQFDPANLSDPALASVPIAGNYFASPEYQQYKVAATAWAEGALRISTGAAATQPEIDRNIQTYFAQPGDTPSTVAFKAQMRAMYDRAVNNALGRPDSGERLQTPEKFAEEMAADPAKVGEPPPPAFIDNPTIKSTAEANGLTPEELWENMSPEARKKFGG